MGMLLHSQRGRVNLIHHSRAVYILSAELSGSGTGDYLRFGVTARTCSFTHHISAEKSTRGLRPVVMSYQTIQENCRLVAPRHRSLLDHSPKQSLHPSRSKAIFPVHQITHRGTPDTTGSPNTAYHGTPCSICQAWRRTSHPAGKHVPRTQSQPLQGQVIHPESSAGYPRTIVFCPRRSAELHRTPDAP